MHPLLLGATLAALLSGPLLYSLARGRPRLTRWLDGFVLVAVAALVIVEVLPGVFAAGGWIASAFLLAGLLGPTAVEHLLSRARREAHLAALWLAICGLVLHSLGDGAALSPGAADPHLALGVAVVVHSVPVGLLVWWLVAPVFGPALAAAALFAMCAGTIAGYAAGVPLEDFLGERGWSWFQALVAGTILHVAFGRPHLQAGHRHEHEHAEG